VLREIPLADGEAYELGQTLTVEQFEPGDKVKITGTSKGRGFQGVVKRHGFAGRPGGHGHPMSRTPGSLGPGTDPSRVIKGKKLPGRMGGARTTIRNVQVVKVDGERNLLFIKGGVPGARDSYVLITK
jgi:large subunit ribosomal protein L3